MLYPVLNVSRLRSLTPLQRTDLNIRNRRWSFLLGCVVGKYFAYKICNPFIKAMCLTWTSRILLRNVTHLSYVNSVFFYFFVYTCLLLFRLFGLERFRLTFASGDGRCRVCIFLLQMSLKWVTFYVTTLFVTMSKWCRNKDSSKCW